MLCPKRSGDGASPARLGERSKPPLGFHLSPFLFPARFGKSRRCRERGPALALPLAGHPPDRPFFCFASLQRVSSRASRGASYVRPEAPSPTPAFAVSFSNAGCRARRRHGRLRSRLAGRVGADLGRHRLVCGYAALCAAFVLLSKPYNRVCNRAGSFNGGASVEARLSGKPSRS